MRYLLLIAILASTHVKSAEGSFSYPHELAFGEWISYHDNDGDGFAFHYLRIEDDLVGAFAYQHFSALGNVEEPTLLSFGRDNVSFEDGYVAISPLPHVRIVLAAYDVPLAKGTMWLYRLGDNQLVPYNSFHLRLGGAGPGEPDEELEKIREVVARLEAAQNDT